MVIDEDYLEHYGVKGMRWGVRKERDPRSEARRQRAKQAAVIVGALAASALIVHSSNRTVRDLRAAQASSTARRIGQIQRDTGSLIRSMQSGRTSANDILRRRGAEMFQPIPMPPVRNAPRPQRARTYSSRASEIAALRESLAGTVRAANQDLRARDNQLNVPFAQRTYLTEWN